jgi:hypothetical protein
MDKPWKVVFSFLGVFVAGAVFGGLLALRVDRIVSERRLQEQAAQAAALAARAPAPPARAQVPAPQPPLPVPQAVQSTQLMRRVTNQLNLTPAQRALVTPLIQRAVQDFWRQQQNYSRENAFLLQRLKQDIAKELTPEQQTRLDDLWLKQLEVFRKRQAEAQAQTRVQNPPRPAEGAPAPSPPPGGEAKPPAPDAKEPPASAVKPPGGTDK